MTKQYFENKLIRFFMWPELTLHGGTLHTKEQTDAVWVFEKVPKSENND